MLCRCAAWVCWGRCSWPAAALTRAVSGRPEKPQKGLTYTYRTGTTSVLDRLVQVSRANEAGESAMNVKTVRPVIPQTQRPAPAATLVRTVPDSSLFCGWGPTF